MYPAKGWWVAFASFPLDPPLLLVILASVLTTDVFHWSCLNEFAGRLPPNTAPAGYACPACRTALFPASNVVSPVVDSLRELLSTVNWARAGLGLPLVNRCFVWHTVLVKNLCNRAHAVLWWLYQTQWIAVSIICYLFASCWEACVAPQIQWVLTDIVRFIN